MRLHSSHRKFFIAIAILAVSLLSYGGGLYLIHRADAHLVALSATIVETELNTREAESLSRFARSLGEERALIEERFVKSADLVTFLGEIEAVARQSGVVLSIDSVGEEQVLLPGATAPKQKVENPAALYYPSIALSLSAVGGWGDVMRFVGMIESMPYGTTVKKVYLEEEPEDASWKALLEIGIAARAPEAS